MVMKKINKIYLLNTRKKKIYARTENQKNYLKALNDEREVIFVIGPAGYRKNIFSSSKSSVIFARRDS